MSTANGADLNFSAVESVSSRKSKTTPSENTLGTLRKLLLNRVALELAHKYRQVIPVFEEDGQNTVVSGSYSVSPKKQANFEKYLRTIRKSSLASLLKRIGIYADKTYA